MSKRWGRLTLILLLLLAMTAAGCAAQDPAAVDGGDQGEQAAALEGGEQGVPPGAGDRFVIVTEDQAETEITVESLKELLPVSKQVEAVRRGGETTQYAVKGALLADVLLGIGKSQADLWAIRLEAGDGYSIEVPQEILKTRQIILAYEVDGKPLEDDARPVRVIIPEERAMYWVRNLIRIEILTPEPAAAVTELVFIESAVHVFCK